VTLLLHCLYGSTCNLYDNLRSRPCRSYFSNVKLVFVGCLLTAYSLCSVAVTVRAHWHHGTVKEMDCCTARNTIRGDTMRHATTVWFALLVPLWWVLLSSADYYCHHDWNWSLYFCTERGARSEARLNSAWLENRKLVIHELLCPLPGPSICLSVSFTRWLHHLLASDGFQQRACRLLCHVLKWSGHLMDVYCTNYLIILYRIL